MKEELIDELAHCLWQFSKDKNALPMDYLTKGEGQITVNRILEWITQKN